MRTRPGLKSCLKITPPITPDLSAASSPCGSGRTSPAPHSDGGSSVGSGGRKTVSFCSQEELEEIYFADEWDRSPAAVTPKLSYQDILELKQLRISLPYTPPPPTSRQPFTTSSPSAAANASNKPPFPVSRFATGPSFTPSKWRNRSQPQHADPEILPYLDAVPIRLLPLLPQSSPPPSPPSHGSSLPEPHPQTPTPTASPERRPIQPPPREPPEIKIEPAVTSPTSPPSPVNARMANFAFMPLLPVQDPVPAPPPPVLPPSGPVRPKRTFNMTFLPVNAVSESEPLMLSDAGSVGTDAPLPSSSSFASGNDPRSNDAGQQASSAPNTSSSPPHAPSQLPPSSNMSPTIFALSLSSSTSQGSALESDGETDTTDTYASDTDAESDAPSTSTLGSSLHSPPLDDDIDAQARLEEIKLGTSDFEFEQAGYAPRIHTQDPGSYFPPVVLADVVPLPIPIPAHTQPADDSPSSGAGQTPPLSVLYPSPTSQQRALPSRDVLSVITDESSDNVVPSSHPEPPSTERAEVDVPSIPTLSSVPLSIMTGRGQDSMPNTPLAMSLALRKKIMLEALPSPALAPPSPFELDPLDTLGAGSASANRAPSKGRILLETSQTELDLLSGATNALEALAASNLTEESTRTPLPGTAETPKDSPMLTLESMRASWDANARVGLGVEAGVAGASSALGPSLSRRRMS
ncbi:uncharacterized protein TRAVEDRAFT_71943 [Trametes versicolor FP-101664 SS1]|uniref:uncharacterized protein n=1 Tax=Trametes versicolor (strain FP-101664) TaxID=717944 RepID=UPI0004621449|nr:uncharacterized protein TRAVEDRAFT_71943 [Trametes versicolor FP-101664 SS1]EIW58303.1 hypothetical protein TRAVEDRAFT_71943 [Trametes versicolor FP-101664 SS1]